MTWSTMRVTGLRLEQPGILGLELSPADGQPLATTWEAGAHVDLRLPGGLVRQYSLAGLPTDGRMLIAVKREAQSRGGSQWVHEQLRIDTLLDVGPPRNLFKLTSGNGPVVLIAAGIGLTPLLAMYRQCLAEGRPVRLLGFSRAPWAPRLLEDLAGDVQWHGGLAAARIAELLPLQLGTWQAGSTLYTCGPPGFMDRVQTTAVELGWPEDALHREHFQPVAQPGTAVTLEDNCELVLARSGTRVSVRPGESLANAAARAGTLLPLSCGMGICGACVTRVVEGEADHRDDCLTPAQRASGQWIAPCVSGCRGERLVLDA